MRGVALLDLDGDADEWEFLRCGCGDVEWWAGSGAAGTGGERGLGADGPCDEDRATLWANAGDEGGSKPPLQPCALPQQLRKLAHTGACFGPCSSDTTNCYFASLLLHAH